MCDVRLLNGDCLVEMQSIESGSVDCIICDLPYGTTACSWDVIIPFDLLWEQYNRIIKNTGAICLFGQEPFSSILRLSNLEMYRYDWVWKKQRPSNFQLMTYQCGRVTENIMVFSKANACYSKTTMVYNPQVQKRENIRVVDKYTMNGNNVLHNYSGGKLKNQRRVYDEKQPVNVLEFNTVEGNERVHPTQKPVQLIEYLIETYTNEGDLVLDNCMGSGTTGVACLYTNRNFIGIEKDKKFFDLASKRIESEKQSNMFL